MHTQNRLAREGEELTTHRFGTGVVGMVTKANLGAYAAWVAAQAATSIVGKVRKTISGKAPALCAICLPPGAQLTLTGIPKAIQNQYGVGSSAQVTFDQLSAQEDTYRDAFRFANGKAVLIQMFGAGVSAFVLSLENTTERAPIFEFGVPIQVGLAPEVAAVR